MMASAGAALFQILQSVLVVLVAPLLVGWVNNCRAWLQNRSAPGLLQPYYTLLRLFHKEALIAANPRCTVILCDDGVQHYALARDVEIVVVDGARGFGNGHLLPAGPLREPIARLESVDAIVRLGVDGPVSADARETTVTHRPLSFRRVIDDGELADAVAAWRGLRVDAVAGIAHPQRFFALLRSLGIDGDTRSFADHHAFVAADLPADADIVVMTQKDAVKCRRFADPRWYYLPIEAELDPRLVDRVQMLIGAA